MEKESLYLVQYQVVDENQQFGFMEKMDSEWVPVWALDSSHAVYKLKKYLVRNKKIGNKTGRKLNLIMINEAIK